MKEFIKKRYNILIPIFLLIVIAIAIFLFAREYKNNRYSETKEEEVYQYFSGVKMEYTAKVSRNRNKAILNYEPEDKMVNLDSTPIYVKDSDIVIFPKEMSIVFPLMSREYKLPSLAEIYKENDLYYVNINRLNKTFDHYFLYDGKNTYFFSDNVTITIGDRKIELSPMSYLSCSYLNFIEYYDRESDTFEQILITNEEVLVSTDYMTIDVSGDRIIYKDGFFLLTNDFSVLSKVTEIEE